MGQVVKIIVGWNHRLVIEVRTRMAYRECTIHRRILRDGWNSRGIHRIGGGRIVIIVVGVGRKIVIEERMDRRRHGLRGGRGRGFHILVGNSVDAVRDMRIEIRIKIEGRVE